MSVYLKWFAPQVYEKIKKEERQRMERATRYLRNEVVKKLGVKVGRDGKKVIERSKPGEPPRLEKGELRRSIATEVVDEGGKIVGRVGTNKKYARPLEVNLDRPFLGATLAERNREVMAILLAKIP